MLPPPTLRLLPYLLGLAPIAPNVSGSNEAEAPMVTLSIDAAAAGTTPRRGLGLWLPPACDTPAALSRASIWSATTCMKSEREPVLLSRDIDMDTDTPLPTESVRPVDTAPGDALLFAATVAAKDPPLCTASLMGTSPASLLLSFIVIVDAMLPPVWGMCR
jgi:hypothetical protein